MSKNCSVWAVCSELIELLAPVREEIEKTRKKWGDWDRKQIWTSMMDSNKRNIEGFEKVLNSWKIDQCNKMWRNLQAYLKSRRELGKRNEKVQSQACLGRILCRKVVEINTNIGKISGNKTYEVIQWSNTDTAILLFMLEHKHHRQGQYLENICMSRWLIWQNKQTCGFVLNNVLTSNGFFLYLLWFLLLVLWGCCWREKIRKFKKKMRKLCDKVASG